MQKNKLFSYLSKEEEKELRKLIVGYLLYGPALYQGNRMVTIQELNDMSRDEMAEQFYYNTTQLLEDIRRRSDEGIINRFKVLDEIAMYMDLKMPSAWMRKKAYKETKTHPPYKGIENIPEAVFKWPENYEIDKLIVQNTPIPNEQ